MTKTPGVPALASDVRRGYLALIIAFSSFLVLTVLVFNVDLGFTQESFVATSFFLYWAFASVLTVIITWLVFRKASAADLKRWLLTALRHTTYKVQDVAVVRFSRRQLVDANDREAVAEQLVSMVDDQTLSAARREWASRRYADFTGNSWSN